MSSLFCTCVPRAESGNRFFVLGGTGSGAVGFLLLRPIYFQSARELIQSPPVGMSRIHRIAKVEKAPNESFSIISVEPLRPESIVCPVCGAEAVYEKCKVMCKSDVCRGRVIMNCTEF